MEEGGSKAVVRSLTRPFPPLQRCQGECVRWIQKKAQFDLPRVSVTALRWKCNGGSVISRPQPERARSAQWLNVALDDMSAVFVLWDPRRSGHVMEWDKCGAHLMAPASPGWWALEVPRGAGWLCGLLMTRGSPFPRMGQTQDEMSSHWAMHNCRLGFLVLY